ncbi:ABC transporter permease [Dethiothermospora halolimnae]|uniref:ABC transporter permease n=1 Tax=Dethiothermospora halolimnae TaxID=3114390 RepID=UPI003CCBB56E
MEEIKKMGKGKITVLVLFIIPILGNLLLGYQFKEGHLKDISLAIYDQDNSSLSRMIIDEFNANETFDINYYVNSDKEIKRLFKNGEIMTAMVIPKDFNKDILKLNDTKILMIYDGSHMPTLSVAKAKASEILLTIKTGVSMKLIGGKLGVHKNIVENISQALKFRTRYLYNPTQNYKNFFTIGMGIAMIQSAIALLAASSILKKKLSDKRLDRIGYQIGKILFYGLFGFLSIMLIIFVQRDILSIPFRGSIFDSAIMSILLSFSVSSFGVMISSIIPDKMIATTINAVIFVPNTIMIGYTWPVLSMPIAYRKVSSFFPYYHYADNIRDMFLKGTEIETMVSDINWYFAFISITVIIGAFGISIGKKDSKGETTKCKEGEVIEAS